MKCATISAGPSQILLQRKVYRGGSNMERQHDLHRCAIALTPGSSERRGGFKYFVCGASRVVVGGRIYNRQTE